MPTGLIEALPYSTMAGVLWPVYWTEREIPDLTGQRVLVTGANTGLGFASVVHLVKNGAEVIMTARSQQKGDQAVAEIKALVHDANVTLMLLDLSKLASVRAFATEFTKRYGSLTVLMNNAGTTGPADKTKQHTEDGLEMCWQSNVYGPFLLTNLLFECLAKGATVDRPSRVIFISSVTHHDKRNRVVPSDPEGFSLGRKKYWVYPVTKLADLMIASALHERVQASKALNGRVLSLCAHPGFSATDMTSHLGWLANAVLSMEPAQGCLSQVRCAVDPTLVGGEYLGPNTGTFALQTVLGPLFLKRNPECYGYPTAAERSEYSRDSKLASELWAKCEELTGATFSIPA